MKSNYLPTDYQTFIATSRYARWLPEEERRESWGETVDRFMANIIERHITDNKTVKQVREAILNLDVMPSMRALMTAGGPQTVTTLVYIIVPISLLIILEHSMRQCSSCFVGLG